MRLISANIEGDRHLARIVPFLEQQCADVICLQETFQHDIPHLVGPMHSLFLPMCLKPDREGAWASWGIAIASRFKALKTHSQYYYQPDPVILPFDEGAKRKTIAHGYVSMRLSINETEMTVATTHFTWTPNGAPDATQELDLRAMLGQLGAMPSHILCGDFNIPRRQNHLYESLISHYTDHIPQDIESSIFVPLHYARRKPGVAEKLAGFMVDYIFSTPDAYSVSNVELHGGLSDHMILTADVMPYDPAYPR